MKLSAGVVVEVATLVVNNGERFPELNEVTAAVKNPVWQPNPVPEVHFRAFPAALQDGTAKSEGVVAVNAPSTVLAVCVANTAVKVPLVVTALDGVLDRTVPSPVKVTLVTVPEPLEL